MKTAQWGQDEVGTEHDEVRSSQKDEIRSPWSGTGGEQEATKGEKRSERGHAVSGEGIGTVQRAEVTWARMRSEWSETGCWWGPHSYTAFMLYFIFITSALAS